jgi:peroxiredoxin
MKLFQTLFLAFIVVVMSSFTGADVNQAFPVIGLKTLDGQNVSTADYIGKGNVTVVSFWASWCAPCKRELDALTDFHEEWKEDHGVEIIAITIDNARGLAKVPGIVASKNWEYTVLSDSKQDLQRALNFQTIPQTFLLDGEGNIIYSHNGYNPGDEYELEEQILSAVE